MKVYDLFDAETGKKVENCKTAKEIADKYNVRAAYIRNIALKGQILLMKYFVRPAGEENINYSPEYVNFCKEWNLVTSSIQKHYSAHNGYIFKTIQNTS